MSWPPSINSFFRYQNVLITGGTGFLGKAVVEKILRDCSNVDTVYLLIRDKPGIGVAKRFQDFCNNEVCPLGLSFISRLTRLYGERRGEQVWSVEPCVATSDSP